MTRWKRPQITIAAKLYRTHCVTAGVYQSVSQLMRLAVTGGGVGLILCCSSCVASDAPSQSTKPTVEKQNNALSGPGPGWLPCGCGAVIGSFQGTDAHCNANWGGNCAGEGPYGFQYQCVELVNRFMMTKYGAAKIWGNAGRDMCQQAARMADYEVYNTPYHGSKSPVPGDALEWDDDHGSYHTALVTAATSSQLTYLQQNWGNIFLGALPTASVGWHGGTFEDPQQDLPFIHKHAVCWIHAKQNTNTGGDCPCYSQNGWYCASKAQEYASKNHCKIDLASQYPSDLLKCKDGVWTFDQPCFHGCSYVPNKADTCTPPPIDPPPPIAPPVSPPPAGSAGSDSGGASANDGAAGSGGQGGWYTPLVLVPLSHSIEGENAGGAQGAPRPSNH